MPHVHRPAPPKSKARLFVRLLARRLRRIGPVYVVAFFVAAGTIYVVERAEPNSKFESFADAVWFCLVTLSTVGYGDIYPVTALGRTVTGAFILFTLTTIGFLLTAVNESVLEVKRMEDYGLIPTQMKNHVIVCGFGPLVRVALAELVTAEREVALIVERPEDIEVARQWAMHGKVFITSGEPTQETLRERMNVMAAETAVVASKDDTLNMVTALNLRALNTKMRIVVALQREELRATMKASGITYVASPNELSGRLVASAAFEPEVAYFIDDVTSGALAGYDLQQFRASPLAGCTVAEIRDALDAMDGPLLVAIAQKHGDEYKVVSHPARSLKACATDYLIVLTNDEQAERFADKYRIKQGR